MIQRDIEYSGQFSKDVKLAQKRHKDMNKLKYLMTLLINNALPLPAVYKDHPLQGSWGNDSNLLIVFYVQIMPDDFVMQLHRF